MGKGWERACEVYPDEILESYDHTEDGTGGWEGWCRANGRNAWEESWKWKDHEDDKEAKV